MIVVDTNVIAYLLLAGERTAQAEALLRHDAQWLAPRLWRSEFRNVLALYLRQQILALDEVLAVAAEAETLMHRREYEVPAFRVLQLVERSGCSAYDCEFVALAQALELPLVTSDAQILRSFPNTAVPLDRAPSQLK